MGLTDTPPQELHQGDARAACGGLRDWTGLYKRDYDLATPESMAHPAKASWDLAFKILAHLEELGLLHEGDCVLDPMAGTSRFVIAAGAKGFRGIAVELEEKFCQMSRDNVAYASHKLCLPGFDLPITIVQGDARHLSELLKERGLVSVTSPPYGFNPLNLNASELDGPIGNRSREKEGRPPGDPLVAITSPPYQDTLKDTKPLSERQDKTAQILRSERPNTYDKTGAGSAGKGYGSTPGQIGALPDKPLKAITSPPFLDSKGTQDKDFLERLGSKNPDGSHRLRTPWAGDAESYGDTEGQIARLPDKPLKVITSPPYGEAMDNKGKRHGDSGICGRDPKMAKMRYDEAGSPENIGNLADRPFKAVLSPPYEDSGTGISKESHNRQIMSGARGTTAIGELTGKTDYGEAEGQIGQEQGPTYLSEMKRVYSELALVADVCVVVTKDPTRNGRLRELGKDTIALLEATGWRIVCVHHSILFEEQEQAHLFEGSKKKVKGRLSFFKRLSYQKGSPVADHEDIIFAVRDNGGGGLKVLTSPPYKEGAWQKRFGDDTYTHEFRRKHDERWGKGRSSSAFWKGNYEGPATSGNIGAFPDKPLKAILLPPYGDQMIKDGQRLASAPEVHWREWERGRKYNEDNPANIGNLPDVPLAGPKEDKNG